MYILHSKTLGVESIVLTQLKTMHIFEGDIGLHPQILLIYGREVTHASCHSPCLLLPSVVTIVQVYSLLFPDSLDRS